MTTNREKNMAHDNREVIRPKTVHYDYTALDAAMRVWFGQAEVTEAEEIYSPYIGA